jgi:hypothetical protein
MVEFERDLMEVEMRLETDPMNAELRAMKKALKKVVDWLRDDCLKHALRRGKLPDEVRVGGDRLRSRRASPSTLLEDWPQYSL